MNKVFDQVMELVLKNEGGYGWDPDDAGGPTNFGITQHDLSVHRGHAVTPDDVKHMTVDEAKIIYFDRYWTPLGLEHVFPLAVCACIMDTGVLYGTHIGATFAQRSVNTIGGNLKVDGQIGPASQTALNVVDVKAFVRTYVANIHARIEGIVRSHPRDKKFEDGWDKRADRLLTLA